MEPTPLLYDTLFSLFQSQPLCYGWTSVISKPSLDGRGRRASISGALISLRLRLLWKRMEQLSQWA